MHVVCAFKKMEHGFIIVNVVVTTFDQLYYNRLNYGYCSENITRVVTVLQINQRTMVNINPWVNNARVKKA